jgi:indolepyruvate ferredoxin oxidoreductase
MKGDCPSFATVTVQESQTAAQRPLPTPPTDIADPHSALVDADDFAVRLTGIGGTGVITVSQILGTAAMLADRTVRGLDQTGLSQKAGPVVSDVCITSGDVPVSNHANASGVDCILAFDLLVGASDANLNGARADRTIMVASTNAVPTGKMVTEPTLALPSTKTLVDRVAAVTRSELNRYMDAGALADGLLGSTTTSNIIVLGAAVQVGAIPVPVADIERAIELNGVAVDTNLAAFRWGRAWIEDSVSVERSADIPVAVPPETVDESIDRLARDLVGFQSEAYAKKFNKIVNAARLAESDLFGDVGDSTVFTHAVAVHLHKLMAYKDEYEVARLLLDDEGAAGYEAVGGSGTQVTYQLHPPMLRSLGLDRKMKLQRTAVPALKTLRASKRVRGTFADPFRWAEVRKVERAMIPEYIAAVKTLSRELRADNLAESVEIASLPDQVRGYEDLKLRRAKEYRTELAARLRDRKR